MCALIERKQELEADRSSGVLAAGRHALKALLRGGPYTNLVAASLLGILSILVTVIDIPLVGSAIRLVGVSILPGWLLAIVLFGAARRLHPVTWFVLTFGLGAVALVFDAFVLTLVGIPFSRNSTTLMGVAVSLVLIGAIAFRQRTRKPSQSGVLLGVLWVSILIVCSAGVLLPLHRPVVKESYTEFYVVLEPDNDGAEYASNAELVLASHESEPQVFRVVCSDASGVDRVVAESRVEPDSVLSVELPVYPSPSGSPTKIVLSAYRDGDVVPYRWVELVGGGCEFGSQRH